MMQKLLLSTMLLSSLALAGPKNHPAKWDAMDPEERAEKHEERARQARMMLLVSVAEALELNEAQALKLSEKLKVIDEKRRPVREAMGEAMRQVKAASEGDAAAAANIDQHVQKVLDGRVQMAQLDKELYATLAEGQTPQKKARLAVVLAKVGEEMRRMRGNKGRHHRQ
ncbi:MAG: hypothetical protein Q8L14_01890 [Myxococcales bacterium]|nr:hypothetical protein [Myxococcales bacterium]